MSVLPVQEQDEMRKFFEKRFIIAPFDVLAANKCAELLHLSLTDLEIKQLRSEGKIAKNRIEYDCMIVATAIVRNVSKIYSHDADLAKFAHGQIEVSEMPVFG